MPFDEPTSALDPELAHDAGVWCVGGLKASSVCLGRLGSERFLVGAWYGSWLWLKQERQEIFHLRSLLGGELATERRIAGDVCR